jgi:hypothetical protein
MREAIPPLPQHVFMVLCSVKHRNNFTFTFYDNQHLRKDSAPWSYIVISQLSCLFVGWLVGWLVILTV